LAVALGTTALAGCAFVDVQLEPVTAIDSLPNVGAGREVLVSPFVDSRPARRCGMKKNGFNTDTANVLCPESNMGFAVGRIFRDYLHAAGFAVVTMEQRRSADPLFIHGRVDQLFVEPVLAFFTSTVETDFGVYVLAQTQSGMTAERYFYVKARTRTSGASMQDSRALTRSPSTSCSRL
jgi:hypothetical protein